MAWSHRVVGRHGGFHATNPFTPNVGIPRPVLEQPDQPDLAWRDQGVQRVDAVAGRAHHDDPPVRLHLDGARVEVPLHAEPYPATATKTPVRSASAGEARERELRRPTVA